MKVENNNVNINVEKVEPKEQPEKIEPAPEKKEWILEQNLNN